MAALRAVACDRLRRAWAGIQARHGAIPGVAIADKVLNGVTCVRLDATVVACHSDKQGDEPNFKGFGLLPELLDVSAGHAGWMVFLAGRRAVRTS
jgi:hypothetical protein